MIKYSETKRGDILRMTKPTPDRAIGAAELVRVKELTKEGVLVEDKHGHTAEFVFNCGAAYLEPTEWRNDFPDQRPSADGAAEATT